MKTKKQTVHLLFRNPLISILLFAAVLLIIFALFKGIKTADRSQAQAPPIPMSNVQLALTPTTALSQSALNISFTTNASGGGIINGSTLEIAFPGGFSITNASTLSCPMGPMGSHTKIAGPDANTLKYLFSLNNAVAAGSTAMCEISSGIVNDSITGSKTITLTLKDATGFGVSETGSGQVTVTAAAPSGPGTLSNPLVTPSSPLEKGRVGSVEVKFTAANPVMDNGSVSIEFPSGFVFHSGGNSTVLTNGTAGAFATPSVSLAPPANQTVVLTASGGGAVTGIPTAEVKFTINNVKYPLEASPGVYKIYTKNASGTVIDKNEIVPGNTFTDPPAAQQTTQQQTQQTTQQQSQQTQQTTQQQTQQTTQQQTQQTTQQQSQQTQQTTQQQTQQTTQQTQQQTTQQQTQQQTQQAVQQQQQTQTQNAPPVKEEAKLNAPDAASEKNEEIEAFSFGIVDSLDSETFKGMSVKELKIEDRALKNMKKELLKAYKEELLGAVSDDEEKILKQAYKADLKKIKDTDKNLKAALKVAKKKEADAKKKSKSKK